MSRLHSQNQPSGTAVNNFANSLIPTGKSLFKEISANIEGNETAIVEDKGGNQAQSQQQDDSFSQVEFSSFFHWEFSFISHFSTKKSTIFQNNKSI